jgi:hypothetical protein
MPEPAWIGRLPAGPRRVLRAFLAAGETPSSFWAGAAGTTAGAAGVFLSSGLDLRSYALTTAVADASNGLPAHVLLTGGLLNDQPASLFSTPNGRVSTLSADADDPAGGFGYGVHGLVVSEPVAPMRGAIFWGAGVVGEGTVRTARATGFAYDLGVRSEGDVADTAQWYAQTRAAASGDAAVRIPLGEFGMTLTGTEVYSTWILAERGVRAIHLVMYRHDTDQEWGGTFTDADGLPVGGAFGYFELGTSGGTEDDEPLTPRTTRVCEIRGYTRGDYMEAV